MNKKQMGLRLHSKKKLIFKRNTFTQRPKENEKNVRLLSESSLKSSHCINFHLTHLLNSHTTKKRRKQNITNFQILLNGPCLPWTSTALIAKK